MSAVSTPILWKNIFSLGFVQAANSLLQLLVMPYVIARIGVDQYGVVAVAQVLMFYLSTFTEYGFNQTGTRDVSLNRQNGQVLSGIFSRVMLTKLILCVVAFAVLLLLAGVVPFIRDHFVLYCLAFVYVPGMVLMPTWYLQGHERMRELAVVTLSSRILFVILVFIFIKNAGDAALYVFFLGLGSLLPGLISIVRSWQKDGLQWMPVSRKAVTTLLKEGWHITASNLSMNIIQYGNIFILRLFANDLVTGYYGVAERIFFSLKQGLVVFSQAAYPRVCVLAAEGAVAVQHFYRRYFRSFFLLVLAGSGAVALAAPYILGFFLQHTHPGAVLLLRMFCVALPLVCLNIPGSLALLAFDQRKKYFGIYGSAVLVSVLLNFAGAYYFEARGTLAAILATELFITAGVTIAWVRLLRRTSI